MAVVPQADQGPRERLLRAGAAALTEAELIALCLRTGGSGYSAVALARHLLEVFGGVIAVSEAPVQRLLAVPGLGPAKVASLLAAWELSRRAASSELPRGVALQDASVAIDYVRAAIGGADREIFGCLFLDARHRPLAFEELFLGSVDRAHVHPRIVLKRALTYNAAAIILAHNHPSGDCQPSTSDIRLTTMLRDLLAQIDVRVVDHLIVTRGGGASMAQLGLLGE
ncbi:MAG: DNA repair protein RadC [Pseudomonadales bacterium]